MRISTERQRELIDSMLRLVEYRGQTEIALTERKVREFEETQREFEQCEAEQRENFKQDRMALESEFLTKLAAARQRYEQRNKNIHRSEEDVLDDIRLRRSQAEESARKSWDLEREHLQQVHQRDAAAARQQWQEYSSLVAQHRQRLDFLKANFREVLARRRIAAADPPPPPSAETDAVDDPSQAFVDALERAHVALRRFVYQPAARFIEDGWPVLLLFLLFAAFAYPAGSTWGWTHWAWAATAAGGAAVSGALICGVVWLLRKRLSARAAPKVQQLLVDAEFHLNAAVALAKQKADARRREIEGTRERGIIQTDENWARKKQEMTDDFDGRQTEEQQQHNAQRSDSDAQWQADTRALNQQYRPAIEQRDREHDQRKAENEQRRQQRIAEIQEQFDRDWQRLVDSWREGVATLDAELTRMNEYCAERFPPWQQEDWSQWKPRSDEELAALRFGSYRLDLAQLPEGIPSHPDLAVRPTAWTAPAVLGFPESPSLLLKATGEGRDAAVATLQNIMLRMLTSFPAGKLRFTIIDPVGLGQNFSAFMHLADFDERLVANRIWTESTHIQQRLTDLTEHMENVIQKYLRNEFESIQQYNRDAGEVAEPFQVLVVANFPHNFSEEAARRLVSIASSGARCGVYTLISVDGNVETPRNFDLADLEQQAGVIQWREEPGRFEWAHEELETLPLTLESPPNDELFSTAVKAAGKLAKESSRVEVPFSFVAPALEARWKADSRAGIEVPLGRAGATKLQPLSLGHGTSQHVLISGKTGSGKSTLLHALITNAALHYGPDEIELYLIDFKKGVEFKPYATYGLPHARVIAIESEREFGMSVLERLDEELKRRGDLFRSAGVQDVNGYRNGHPEECMPRVLLIIDEFQEFFVKDDKIAQDASLLLDRLVRQGRAFGIHVLLGSQTLAGAYTLARSTIGQMAVRIALQCSEGDAHLILSEDNTAARLLNRPGEAIYNDANGTFEGNHPFQTVWLPDQEREGYLRDLQTLNAQRETPSRETPSRETPSRETIVFEGNMPADPARNPLLCAALETPPDVRLQLAPVCWLGAAVAIKDPTSVVFARQSGANLLLVGQQEEAALGVMSAALVGVAAHLNPQATPPPRFAILDGTRPDSPEAGFWRRFADALPLDIRVARPRDAEDVIRQAAELLDQRLADSVDDGPPLLLVIHNLSRFRDLKAAEDFSFSFDEDRGPTLDKLLSRLLREGPSFGIHCMLWCDSYNNVTRFLDRQSMRDLEYRVLFQMSGNDSASLMDSPAASRLGANRAIFHNEEVGESEKFRPYGLPDVEWLASVAAALGGRSAAMKL